MSDERAYAANETVALIALDSRTFVFVQDPSTKEWLMFHIGDGGQTNGSAFMHHSTSLYGPWTPLQTTQTCGMPSAGYVKTQIVLIVAAV